MDKNPWQGYTPGAHRWDVGWRTLTKGPVP